MPKGIYKRIIGVNYHLALQGFQKGYSPTTSHIKNLSKAMTGKTWKIKDTSRMKGFQKGQHTKAEFKKGHIGWNKGLTKETDERVRKSTEKISGEKNYMFGNGYLVTGKKNGMFGKHQTMKSNEKNRQSQLKRYKEYPVTNETKEKLRIARLNQSFLFNDTKIEIKMQNELKRRDIQFVKQKPLLKKYLVDLFIEPNIVIECDGCYYHACKKCGFTKYYQDKLNKDEIKTRKLKEAGYKVYRFWGHEINESSEKCINKIKWQ